MATAGVPPIETLPVVDVITHATALSSRAAFYIAACPHLHADSAPHAPHLVRVSKVEMLALLRVMATTPGHVACVLGARDCSVFWRVALPVPNALSPIGAV
jgi:hypothetical protein